jgi:HEAT repeat protein
MPPMPTEFTNWRGIYEVELIKALGLIEDKEVKAFIISQLQLVGTDSAVDAMSGYVADDRLCDDAIRCIVTIASRQANSLLHAKDILRQTLKAASGVNRIAIVKALGELKDSKSVKNILKFTTADDVDLKMVSLWALANIGDKSVEKVLLKNLAVAKDYKKAKLSSYYILYAQRVAEKSKRKSSKIYRNIIKGRKIEFAGNVKCAAYSGLVSNEGKKALDDLLAAMDSDSIKVRAMVLTLAGEIAGESETKKWVKKADGVSGTVRAEIVEMLADRKDETSVSAIMKYLDDTDKAVRLAAIKGAFKAGGQEGVHGVIELLKKTSDADEINEAKQAFLCSKETYVIDVIAKSIGQMSAGSKVALIEVLALRNAKVYSDIIFTLADDENESVSVASLKALGSLAGAEDMQRLVDLFVKAKTPRQRLAGQKTVVLIAKQMPPGRDRTSDLLNAFNESDDSKKIHLLSALRQVGGKDALDAILADIKSSNKEVAKAAVRTLSKWDNAEAIPGLFDIATSSDDLVDQVIAIRAITKLAKLAEFSATQKVDIFRKALKLAKRPEEKKLLLAGLGNIRAIESLQLVSEYLDDKAVRKDVVAAAVKIACPADEKDKGLNTYDAAMLLKRVVRLAEDSELKGKINAHINSIPAPPAIIKPVPDGFVKLFNGKDLTSWKGLLAGPYDNPIKRAKLTPDKLAAEQAKADKSMRKHWTVVDGVLIFDGGGTSIATADDYGDFEMLVDWKIVSPHGDSGIYLRGAPQVQIWDPGQHKVGSGGLYNNKENASKPSEIADNPIGYWNTFRIKMVGEKVTVHLNNKLIVDDVVMENYWDRKQPIFSIGQLELQCHGDPIEFTNIFIREIPRAEKDFTLLFNGDNLDGWVGDTKGYIAQGGKLVCKPGGNLYTADEYDDFILRFEFKLTEGANNGLGIRAPLKGNAAYQGMELQILDNSAEKYNALKPYQYHGSIYGVVPAKRGHLKPVGQWNSQEVIARGNLIKVVLNGTTIVDADIAEASKDGTMDGHAHPGLKRKGGHIGFLGHGSVVEFRNIRINQFEEE